MQHWILLLFLPACVLTQGQSDDLRLQVVALLGEVLPAHVEAAAGPGVFAEPDLRSDTRGQCHSEYFEAIFAKFRPKNGNVLENQCYDKWY
jgi:hypothetical protein